MKIKKLIVYMPLFGSAGISSKTFKSFVEMAMERIEGYQIEPFIHTVGPSLDFNRNDAIARMLDMNADLIMFCDGDQTFPKNSISNLLESISKEYPIVTGIYFRKANPHRCVVGNYTGWDDRNERYRKSLESIGFIDGKGEQCLFYECISDFNKKQEVNVFGMGCVLIKTSVFSSLEQPYFKYVNAYQTGDHSFGSISEDMWFCAYLKKRGIKVLCDPNVRCGHITEIVVDGPQKVLEMV